MEPIRLWRNGCLESLRTPFLLTCEMQEAFYRNVVCNRKADARYWGIWRDCGDLQPEKQCLHLVGMGGFDKISMENSNAEISLILNPEYRGKGMAEQAVELLLQEAFQNMNLKTVYGEVYRCNKAGVTFWERIAAKYAADKTELTNRKFWDGMYWNSFYFSIDRTISASHKYGTAFSALYNMTPEEAIKHDLLKER
jgi:RimJ/RimL family protein N-acetyltransferase